jgi:hypothetical protein
MHRRFGTLFHLPRRCKQEMKGIRSLIPVIRLAYTAYEDESVPKRRHIKFRCRGIIQKKEYDSTCVFLGVVMNGAVWTHNVAVCNCPVCLNHINLGQWFVVDVVTIC